jgi:type I restriction enzyme S subunit
MVRLGEVATIERDSVQPEDIQGGTMYVGLENIESGGRFLNVKPVEKGELASSKFKFTPKHLLYGKLRPYLAKIALPSFDGICSTDILPILPSEQLDVRYLKHYLSQQRMVNIANSLATGANLPRISPTALANLEIPLPPLTEQIRIAAILGKANEIRRKRELAITRLNHLAQSVFLEMFGNPKANRKNFNKERLGDLIKLKSGDFLPAKSMSQNGTYPVFGGNGISGYHDKFMFEDRQIVIGRVGAYCGCVHVTPGESWVTDNALYVESFNDELEFDYLAFALEIADLHNVSSQSGQPLVSGARIYREEILVPPRLEQQKFSRFMAARAIAMQRLERASDKVRELIGSVQSEAFGLRP